jgi:hypothetical protein
MQALNRLQSYYTGVRRQSLLPADPRLFVHGLFPAPFAKLGEFNFALNSFLILMGIIITPLANGTAQRNQIVRIFNLCHIEP